ncbi:MAG: NAD(+)/NADH kinase [Christensenellales bacterium]
MSYKRIGIYANPKRDKKLAGTAALARLLRDRGLFVCFDEKTLPYGETDIIDYGNVDCLFVLGGDGTILKAALKTCRFGVPMLGFNLGRLGFLTETKLCEAEQSIDTLLNGNFYVEERIMLDCTVKDGLRELFFIEALNDAAILKKEPSRMISLKLFIGETLADDVACDGILVSTPTGSTGYSLSAGGPILSPQLKCLLATPICAHSLHSRSLVVTEDERITIRPAARSGMVLTTDGTKHIDIKNGQEVVIKKSSHTARFIRFSPDYFYPLLRKKFINWDR